MMPPEAIPDAQLDGRKSEAEIAKAEAEAAKARADAARA